tara:strand:+ start:1765 stop:2718 length:954 start_codon:yes stop_codon:yes gene_type:complete
MHKKSLSTYLQSFLTITAIFFCSISYSHTLRVGTTLWPGYEPLYLANKINAYEGDIRMINYPSTSEVLRAFKNKTLEVAALTLDEVLFLAASDTPIDIILVLDISEGADVIMGRPELKNMNGLIGARIAVESTAVGAYTLSRALEIHNITIEQVSLVNVEHSSHKESYIKGIADAVVTFEPVRTQLLNKGAIELFSSKEIPGEIIDVLVVHKNTPKTHGSELSDLLQGWFKALTYLKNEADESHRFIASRMKISPNDAKESYFGLTLPSLDQNKALLTGEPAPLQKTLKRLTKHMMRSQLIDSDSTQNAVLNPSFLP